tara:strand:- start:4800 stop:4949 length:150 start_codon:yes stop_codon:yes gene_type:complete
LSGKASGPLKFCLHRRAAFKPVATANFALAVRATLTRGAACMHWTPGSP